jgi:hypothetical protein
MRGIGLNKPGPFFHTRKRIMESDEAKANITKGIDALGQIILHLNLAINSIYDAHHYLDIGRAIGLPMELDAVRERLDREIVEVNGILIVSEDYRARL